MTPLVHLVRRPANRNAPLVLLLHGVGSNEEDLFSLESEFPDNAIVISARAPLTLRPGSYGWFPVTFGADGPVIDPAVAETSRQALADFVVWAAGEYGADAERVVSVGFSQGAIMTASLALTRPELVRGAVLMSGRILPEVLPRVAPPHERQAVGWLIVHGTLDPVLPVEFGRQARATLRSLGVEPEYEEYPMAHTVSDASLQRVTAWVKARTR